MIDPAKHFRILFVAFAGAGAFSLVRDPHKTRAEHDPEAAVPAANKLRPSAAPAAKAPKVHAAKGQKPAAPAANKLMATAVKPAAHKAATRGQGVKEHGESKTSAGEKGKHALGLAGARSNESAAKASQELRRSNESAAKASQELKVHWKQETLTHGANRYYVHAYEDSDCMKAENQVTTGDGPTVRDKFEAADSAGCFNIVYGSLKGSSMLLSCSPPTDEGDEVVVRTLYEDSDCKGYPLKTRMMKWSFFEGLCQHKERMVPPLHLSDYPACKKPARPKASAKATDDPHASSATRPGKHLRKDGGAAADQGEKGREHLAAQRLKTAQDEEPADGVAVDGEEIIEEAKEEEEEEEEEDEGQGEAPSEQAAAQGEAAEQRVPPAEEEEKAEESAALAPEEEEKAEESAAPAPEEEDTDAQEKTEEPAAPAAEGGDTDAQEKTEEPAAPAAEGEDTNAQEKTEEPAAPAAEGEDTDAQDSRALAADGEDTDRQDNGEDALATKEQEKGGDPLAPAPEREGSPQEDPMAPAAEEKGSPQEDQGSPQEDPLAPAAEAKAAEDGGSGAPASSARSYPTPEAAEDGGSGAPASSARSYPTPEEIKKLRHKKKADDEQFSGQKADYTITVFKDDECTNATQSEQHGVKATTKRGCFDMVWGASAGSSFSLVCSASAGNILRTMYDQPRCEGVALKMRTMHWDMFEGGCTHKARMDPGLKEMHYPACKLSAEAKKGLSAAEAQEEGSGAAAENATSAGNSTAGEGQDGQGDSAKDGAQRLSQVHGGVATYNITVYEDSHCKSPKADGLKAGIQAVPSVPGCYNVHEGTLAGNSFFLTCIPSAVGSVIRMMYDAQNCDGNVLKMGVMKWIFFEGRCLENEQITPPMDFVDFPECRKVTETPRDAQVTSGANAPDFHRPEYLMTVYHEDDCKEVKDSSRDGFSASPHDGCYNIVKGSLAGYSFLLNCVPDQAYIIRTIYEAWDCKSSVLKIRMMPWSFYEGKCQNKQDISPALRLSDYPKCRKDTMSPEQVREAEKAAAANKTGGVTELHGPHRRKRLSLAAEMPAKLDPSMISLEGW